MMKVEQINKTKSTFLNAIFSILLTLINGLLSIVVTRLIIQQYGSDFNGINSTANQIINVLLVLEGGFTLASNVALFESIGTGDYKNANGILNATRTKFKKIGLFFLIIGILVAIIYSVFAKTDLSNTLVFSIVLMAVIPQAINLFAVTVYRVVLQAQQREYVVSGFSALTIGLGHIVNIIVISHGGKMWVVRFVTMSFAILNCFLISEFTRKKNKFLNSKEASRPDLITGTSDVMIQKVTGVIYSSWPIIFLSISANAGTTLASVYAVYNSVMIMIKALLHGVIDAPRLGFGQMLTERDKKEVWEPFKQYEYISIVFTFISMTTTSGAIMPFIRMYTKGVNDVNYFDVNIAVLMILAGSIEMIHIPSGHLMNMAGHFKQSKKFQIISCIVLIISMAVLGNWNGIYGMLWSLLIVSILLALLEIRYIHTIFFNEKCVEFILMGAPYAIFGILLSAFELKYSLRITEVSRFMIFTLIMMLINSCFTLFVSFLFHRKLIISVIRRVRGFLKM